MIFNPTVTEVGQAAAFNADSTGTELVITDISFGLASYNPTGLEEALVNEVVKVPVASGSRLSPTQICMNGVWDDDAASSPINEVGIWAGATLFAVWSRTSGGPLGYKTPGVDFVFNYSMLLTVVPPGSVTVIEDSGTSAVLAALMSHEGDVDAHPQYMKRIRRIWTGEATGTPNALILTPAAPDAITAFEEGQGFVFVAAANNTGAATVQVPDVDTLALKKQGSLDLDANDLIAGAVYEAIYDGTNLQLVSGGGAGGAGGQTFETEKFTATAGQTTFAVTYTPGNVMVFQNGRQLSPDDYTASNGTDVVLDTGALLGDEILVVGFSSFSVANVVNLTDAQTINGVKTFVSSPIVPTVSASDSTQKAASTAQVQAAITARVATTTAAGIVELATNAETQAGSDASRAVTPASLASVQATTSARGLIEIATNAEAQAMTDTVRALVPSNLAALRATGAEVAAGTSNQRFLTPASLAAGQILNYMHVRDEKGAGTDGGDFADSARRDRTLNTVVQNTITGASLAANVITLPAGVYEISARAPAFDVGRHQVYFYNVTDSADAIVGSSANTTSGAANPVQTDSVIHKYLLSIAGTKTFKLQHRCSNTNNGDGFGKAANLGAVEVYSEVFIKKVG